MCVFFEKCRQNANGIQLSDLFSSKVTSTLLFFFFLLCKCNLWMKAQVKVQTSHFIIAGVWIESRPDLLAQSSSAERFVYSP